MAVATPRTATVSRTREYTAAMTKRLVLLSLLSCLLAACGNKGPLVLPEQPAAAPAVETPAGTPAMPAAEPSANPDGTPASQP